MRIPRIADVLGLIDEKHISEAMDYRRKRAKLVWMKYGALAACLVLIIGIAAFAVRESRMPVRPDPDNTTPTVGTDNTTPPVVTDPVDPNPPDPLPSDKSEMPPPFSSYGNGTGGDENAGFYMTTDFKLDGIDASLFNLVGWETAVEWMQETSAFYGEYTAVGEAANLYSFIKHFDIPDETVRDFLISTRNGDMYDFTDEEIELVLSDDTEAVAEHFAWECAIRKGDNLYSLNWIYLHPIEDYEAAGITPEDIEEKLPYFERYRLSPNAKYALEQKLSEYIVPTGDGVTFMYSDYTIIYNNDMPLVNKEFVVIGHSHVSDEILYLIDNNRADGDDTVYAVLFMWDQLIHCGFDGMNSWRPYQAFLSQHYRSDYLKEPQPIPVGTVVRIAWDGLCESEGFPKRLTWISRLQFSESESVFSESEIMEYAAQIDGIHLNIDEFEDDMFLNNPGYEAIGNGYEFVPGLSWYYPVDDTDAIWQLSSYLTQNAEMIVDSDNYIVGLPGTYGGNWYLCDYDLSEDETYLFMELAKYAENQTSEHYEKYDLSHARDPEAVSKGVTVYTLVPRYAFQNTYIMLKYSEPVERNGKTVYGELYSSPIGIDLPMDESEVSDEIIDEPVEEAVEEII